MTLNPDTVKNILTLRYDSYQKPLLPKMTWKNFVENDTIPSIDFIEKSIENTIKNQLETKNIKNISIALSGGVDSTLILAFLRKILPDILLCDDLH